MTALTIRKFQPGEEARLWQIFHGAVHRGCARDYTPAQLDAWAPSAPDLKRWARRIRKIDPFVAVIEGEIVGYADIQPDGLIDHFFVDPDRLRRGIGSQLMAHIIRHAASRRIHRLHTWASITAQPFFAAHGFRTGDENRQPIGGQVLTNYRMSRSLGRD